jgi:hypothetical protein
MKIYLAGRMTGVDQFNFPLFAEATASLRRQGHEVASPAEHDLESGFDPTLNSLEGFNPETAMRWDLDRVYWADAVVVLPDWQKSRGAAIETRLCWFLGKPVLQYPQLWPIEPADRPVQPSGETRVTSATGGEKGSKPEKLGAIDPLALRILGRVAAMGEEKYSRFNFLRGYAWSLSVDALLRHLMAFLDGEDLDPESGLPHTAHVAWHGLALTSFLERHIGEDDRFHG